MSIQTDNNIHIKYLHRVKDEIPIINQGYSMVFDAYNHFKDSSPPLMKWGLEKVTGTAENAIYYSLSHVRGPLRIVDSMLCTTLTMVENNLPAITKPPKTLYEDSRTYVKDMIHPFNEWMDIDIFPNVEIFIDKYLPELEPENGLADKEEKIKVFGLAKTMIRRSIDHSIAEPKFLLDLTINGSLDTFKMMIMLVLNKKDFFKLLDEKLKKLEEGVTSEDEKNSKLYVQMASNQLVKGCSGVIKRYNFLINKIDPIIDWVHSHFLFPVEVIVNYCLPELEPDAELAEQEHFKLLRLPRMVIRRSIDHSIAESKFLLDLTINGSLDTSKMVILLFWNREKFLKKLSKKWEQMKVGLTPEEEKSSRLYFQMIGNQLMKGCSIVVRGIDFTAVHIYDSIYEFLKHLKYISDDVINATQKKSVYSKIQEKQESSYPPKDTGKDAPKDHTSFSKNQPSTPSQS